MKKIYFTISLIAALLLISGVQTERSFISDKGGIIEKVLTGELTAKPVPGNKKILVVYFSHTGNTRTVAGQIHNIAGGDIFEIQAVKGYPEDYEAVKKVAKQELNSGIKPALKTEVTNIKSYDIIFIGYPVWWGTFPAPVRTFLSGNDLSGKTIVPFCTHLGSGLGNSVKDVSKICPNSTLLEGVAVSGNDVKTSQNKISEWLKKIKITK